MRGFVVAKFAEDAVHGFGPGLELVSIELGIELGFLYFHNF